MSLESSDPPARLAVPADRGLRLPVGLRDLRAGRTQRRDRMDVPAPPRRPERVRRAAGPRRGHVPARPGGHDGSGGAPVPAGDDDPGDVLGHQPRLADRPRRAARRPVARHRGAQQHAPPRAHRLRRRPRPAAHDPLRQRLGRGPDGVRPDLRLRPPLRPVGVRGRRLWRGDGECRGLADQAAPHHRPAGRVRGLARPRGQHAARRRHRVRRAGVLRSPRAEDLQGRVRPAGQDRRLLAPVARPRRLPGPSRGASTSSEAR